MPNTRRDFLKYLIGGLTLGSSYIQAKQKASPSGIPTRPLGKTGEQISIIGLGGHTIAKIRRETEAIGIMHEAIDNGITFFDNSWDYHRGKAEVLMGKALATDARRDRVFLMSKICARLAKDTTPQIEESLQRLQTDRLDLLLFHGIKRDQDADLIFSDKGALRAVQKAQQAGKIRYIGFSGHADPRFHLRMMQHNFDFDAILMPISVLDAHYRSFQKEVLPDCIKKDIGVLGMKALSVGTIPEVLGINATLCRNYALSMPISSLLCGIQSREDLIQDINIARNFQPLNNSQVKELLKLSEKHASDGRYERYKTRDAGCNWHVRNSKT